MAENLIFVPESDEEKVKKILGARVVLALEIANESSRRWIKKMLGGRTDGKPETELFAVIFQQVFQALE